MANGPPYCGPFEDLTVEECAARNRCSAEHFMSIYDGPRLYLGENKASMLRIPAWALHDWSVARAFTPGAVSGATAWDKVGDGYQEEPKDVSARPRNKGAKR